MSAVTTASEWDPPDVVCESFSSKSKVTKLCKDVEAEVEAVPAVVVVSGDLALETSVVSVSVLSVVSVCSFMTVPDITVS